MATPGPAPRPPPGSPVGHETDGPAACASTRGAPRPVPGGPLAPLPSGRPAPSAGAPRSPQPPPGPQGRGPVAAGARPGPRARPALQPEALDDDRTIRRLVFDLAWPVIVQNLLETAVG